MKPEQLSLTTPAPVFAAGARVEVRGEEWMVRKAEPTSTGHTAVHVTGLTFAEVFAQRGGMDVFLGNPPWVKVEWKEAGVLGDIDPLLNLRKLSAKKVADERKRVLASEELADLYLTQLPTAQGQGAFIASAANYPLLRGVQRNLYKCFIERMGKLGGGQGTAGLPPSRRHFRRPERRRHAGVDLPESATTRAIRYFQEKLGLEPAG